MAYLQDKPSLLLFERPWLEQNSSKLQLSSITIDDLIKHAYDNAIPKEEKSLAALKIINKIRISRDNYRSGEAIKYLEESIVNKIDINNKILLETIQNIESRDTEISANSISEVPFINLIKNNNCPAEVKITVRNLLYRISDQKTLDLISNDKIFPEEFKLDYHDKRKLKIITSSEVRSLYDQGKVDYQEIQKTYDSLGYEAFYALIIDEWVQKLYSAGIKFDELKDMYNKDQKKFDSIRSSELLDLFTDNNKVETFKILSNLYDNNIEKFEIFNEYYTIKAIKEIIKNKESSKEVLEQLSGIYDSDKKEFDKLISRDAIKAYQNGAKIDDLKNIDSYKLETLISNDALNCYKKKICKFDDLKDIDDQYKIKALTSKEAQLVYKKGYTKFSELVELNTDEIQVKTQAIKLEKYIVYDKAITLNLKQIEVLANSWDFVTVENFLKDQQPSFEDIKKLEPKKMKQLIIYAKNLYAEQGAKFNDLKDLTVEQLNILTDYHTKIIFEYVPLKDFKNLESNIMEAIVSSESHYLYEKGKFEQVKDFEPKKIKALTSRNITALYQKDDQLFARCTTYSAEKINALGLYDANASYYFKNKQVVSFNELEKYDAEKIKLITSYSAYQGYENNLFQFNDIKNFAAQEIKDVINTEKDKVQDKIKLLTAQKQLQSKMNTNPEENIQQTATGKILSQRSGSNSRERNN